MFKEERDREWGESREQKESAKSKRIRFHSPDPGSLHLLCGRHGLVGPVVAAVRGGEE